MNGAQPLMGLPEIVLSALILLIFLALIVTPHIVWYFRIKKIVNLLKSIDTKLSKLLPDKEIK